MSRKAVLSIHECHLGDFFTIKPPRKVHKQEDPRVFPVLKTLREVHKQQEYFSFSKDRVECKENKVFLVRKAPREVHKKQSIPCSKSTA